MEVRFAGSAKRYLDSQPNNVRSKLINDVVWLADNPVLLPDDETIVPFDMPPAVGKMFRDDFHWIIFYVEGDSIVIANIGEVSESPHLWRPPS